MHPCDQGSAPDRVEVVLLDDSSTHPPDPPETKILSIGNVASMFDVSPLRLLAYEWLGLIRRRHMLGRMRVYSWADCERIAFIVKCRRAAVPLWDIISLVKSTDADDVASGTRRAALENCEALLGQLEAHRKVVDEALAELRHARMQLTTRDRRPGESD